MTGAPSPAHPAEPRRVVVVLHEETLGGASLSIVRLVPLLERRGWRFVFWVSEPSPLADALRGRGLEVHGVPRPIVYSLVAARLPPGVRRRIFAAPGYARAFRSFLHRSQPSVLHANSLFTMAEALVARTAGVPVVFHIHEMLPQGWKGRAGRRLAHTVPGELVVVSEASARELAHRGRRPRVVNECAPYPAAVPTRQARDGRTVVGTVGVISTRKGTDVFVDAARIVRDREPAVSFHIVGSPTDELEVDWARGVLAEAAELGIVHEPRADVPARLAEWDVFALPSRRDPFPISMLEAMGSALPVVGSAVDGIPEQVSPEAGLLTPPGDPEALAEAIVELHRHPERRAAMGLAGRDRVLERFTLQRQAEGMHAAYIAALDEGSG